MKLRITIETIPNQIGWILRANGKEIERVKTKLVLDRYVGLIQAICKVGGLECEIFGWIA